MRIPVPDYLLRNYIRHVEAFVRGASYDRSDTRTANALRLLMAEGKKLNKRINDNKKTNDNDI